MNRKVLISSIIFIICISNLSYGLELSLPVWSETESIEKANAEALRRKFFKYRK